MDRNQALKMKKIFEEEVKKLNAVTKKMSKLQEPRASYMTQLAENESVIKELGLLDEEDNVFKMMGPVLVKQELDVAKRDVNNRISFFKKQLKQIEKSTATYTKEQAEIRSKVQGMQSVMMQSMKQAQQQQAQA